MFRRCNWQYVAGFFDGEGSICVSPYRVIKVDIAQKDITPLLIIQQFLQEHDLPTFIHIQRSTGVHHLAIFKKESVRDFLRVIAPLLIVKKQQAEDAWRFLTMFPSLTNKQSRGLAREVRIAQFALPETAQVLARRVYHRKYQQRRRAGLRAAGLPVT